ncbi:MAG: hypothetical protein AB1767_06350 [Bacillota bacterium]
MDLSDLNELIVESREELLEDDPEQHPATSGKAASLGRERKRRHPLTLIEITSRILKQRARKGNLKPGMGADCRLDRQFVAYTEHQGDNGFWDALRAVLAIIPSAA